MSDQEKPLPVLGETKTDHAVSLAKGALGAIPLVGSLIAEMVGTLVPRQRMDRIEDYLNKLAESIKVANEELLKQKLNDPDIVDLIEEGGFQSARAISEERRQHIAKLVTHGVSGDEKDRIEAKRLLSLLKEIDDDQIIILTGYLRRYLNDHDFHERHAAVLEPVGAHLGSSREELDRETMFELARGQLVNLGLLKPRYQSLRKGEMPEFDRQTGTIRSMGNDLTPLGRILLARIGVAEPGEF